MRLKRGEHRRKQRFIFPRVQIRAGQRLRGVDAGIRQPDPVRFGVAFHCPRGQSRDDRLGAP